MTIAVLDRTSGDLLGFVVSGDVVRADYEVLTSTVAAALADHDEVRVLLDLTDFHRERISAWGADLRFGRTYHDKIARMAIVGNKKWEEHLTQLSAPFYAREAAFFEDEAAAWAWLAAAGATDPTQSA